jgi:hypothetical protein
LVVKIDKNVDVSILNDEIVTLTKCNHIAEIQYLSKNNKNATIKKLNKFEYVELATGEIKKFAISETRADNVNSLKQTFKKLRYLINNNFVGALNEFFVTLTFAPDSSGWRPSVSDTEYLSKVSKAFLRRLKLKYGRLEFVRVLEPHADGHAHFHMLLRFDDFDKIYIANKELNELWGHGFVKINSLKDVDNIGAYVSAYFTDIELDDKSFLDECMADSKARKIDVVEKGNKKFIKGGRLKYYPTGVQIFNKSKGLKYPDRERMTYLEAKEKAGVLLFGRPTYSKSYSVEIDDFELLVKYEYYNSKRQGHNSMNSEK